MSCFITFSPEYQITAVNIFWPLVNTPCLSQFYVIPSAALLLDNENGKKLKRKGVLHLWESCFVLECCSILPCMCQVYFTDINKAIS